MIYGHIFSNVPIATYLEDTSILLVLLVTKMSIRLYSGYDGELGTANGVAVVSRRS